MSRRLVPITLVVLSSIVAAIVASIVAAFAVYQVKLRPLQRTWGVEPGDAERELPGDDVVKDPAIVETRGITISATPDAIWPWLPQMGFGRAGWYSYDRLDNTAGSVRRILPEYQDLKVGDTIPAFPGGGFRVESIEPGASLVLYLDSELMKQQTEAARAAASAAVPSDGDGRPADLAGPAGLQAAGAMGGMTMPQMRGTWAMVLDPVDATQTRLIERMRIETPEPSRGQRAGLPFMGMGVFLMTRKQMLGIKERAEQGPEPEPATEPAPGPEVAPAGA
jgi:hypothetical protein